MKKDWITQEIVSETGNKLVEEMGLQPDEVTGYQVAQALGKASANGSVMDKVRAWQNAEREARVGYSVELPTEALTALNNFAEEQKTAFITIATRLVSDGYNDIQRAADLKNAGITKLANQAQTARKEVIDQLVETDDKLDAARGEIDALTTKLETVQQQLASLEVTNATLRELIASSLRNLPGVVSQLQHQASVSVAKQSTTTERPRSPSKGNPMPGEVSQSGEVANTQNAEGLGSGNGKLDALPLNLSGSERGKAAVEPDGIPGPVAKPTETSDASPNSAGFQLDGEGRS